MVAQESITIRVHREINKDMSQINTESHPCLNKEEITFVTILVNLESIHHIKWSWPRKSKCSFMAFINVVLKQTNNSLKQTAKW